MSYSEVIVVCEDDAQGSFIRTFLKRRGYGHQRIRVLGFPSGKGSGAKFVLDKVANELKGFRACQAKALIVMIDADNHEVSQRKAQLNKACQTRGITTRSADEAALFLVPMRNIESWLRYLNSQEWNETENFRLAANDGLAKQAARSLHRMCFDRQKLKQPAPASLVDACLEWERF